MNIYHKLIQLAESPCYNVALVGEAGGSLESSSSVVTELKREFEASVLESTVAVDFRQACETRIFDS